MSSWFSAPTAYFGSFVGYYLGGSSQPSEEEQEYAFASKLGEVGALFYEVKPFLDLLEGLESKSTLVSMKPVVKKLIDMGQPPCCRAELIVERINELLSPDLSAEGKAKAAAFLFPGGSEEKNALLIAAKESSSSAMPDQVTKAGGSGVRDLSSSMQKVPRKEIRARIYKEIDEFLPILYAVRDRLKLSGDAVYFEAKFPWNSSQSIAIEEAAEEILQITAKMLVENKIDSIKILMPIVQQALCAISEGGIPDHLLVLRMAAQAANYPIFYKPLGVTNFSEFKGLIQGGTFRFDLLSPRQWSESDFTGTPFKLDLFQCGSQQDGVHKFSSPLTFNDAKNIKELIHSSYSKFSNKHFCYTSEQLANIAQSLSFLVIRSTQLSDSIMKEAQGCQRLVTDEASLFYFPPSHVYSRVHIFAEKPEGLFVSTEVTTNIITSIADMSDVLNPRFYFISLQRQLTFSLCVGQLRGPKIVEERRTYSPGLHSFAEARAFNR